MANYKIFLNNDKLIYYIKSFIIENKLTILLFIKNILTIFRI